MPDELNRGKLFGELTKEQQDSFRRSPMPELIRLNSSTRLYKWTEYPLVGSEGRITEYWSPWEGFEWNRLTVPGFTELRLRYRNHGGEVGAPRDFARARQAVTVQWNDMDALLHVELVEPVWRFIGICAGQRVFKDKNRPEHQSNIFFIGGDFQLCIPNLSIQQIRKL